MATRTWDQYDEEAMSEGKALRTMGKNFSGCRPTHNGATGGRHVRRRRNRKCVVATPRRNEAMGELGVIM